MAVYRYKKMSSMSTKRRTRCDSFGNNGTNFIRFGLMDSPAV